MAIEKVTSVLYTETTHPEVIAVLNELAELDDRSATKCGELLLIEFGKEKIARLKAQSQQVLAAKETENSKTEKSQ